MWSKMEAGFNLWVWKSVNSDHLSLHWKFGMLDGSLFIISLKNDQPHKRSLKHSTHSVRLVPLAERKYCFHEHKKELS